MNSRPTRLKHAAVILLAGIVTSAASGKTLSVCPAGSTAKCDFSGNQALQAAVDKAADGDTVLVRPGTYTSAAFVDVPYKQYVIRGSLAIRHKRIEIVGEEGAVLDGTAGPPVSAIVVEGGAVALRNLTIRNFRAGDPEDDLYEGHGIFVIDAAVALNDVTIEKYAKMGFTGRGSSSLTASGLRILDGHVAIWLEESAHLRLCNALVRNNDSAGIAAYMNATARVYNSVFDGNQDDGLYAGNEASIFATNTLLLNNKPFAVRVTDDAQAQVRYTALQGNAAKGGSPEGKQSIRWGEGVQDLVTRPDANYRLAAPLTGDPDVRTSTLDHTDVGLSDVAACGGGQGR
jgi:hypothetical protein